MKVLTWDPSHPSSQGCANRPMKNTAMTDVLSNSCFVPTVLEQHSNKEVPTPNVLNKPPREEMPAGAFLVVALLTLGVRLSDK